MVGFTHVLPIMLERFLGKDITEGGGDDGQHYDNKINGHQNPYPQTAANNTEKIKHNAEIVSNGSPFSHVVFPDTDRLLGDSSYTSGTDNAEIVSNGNLF